MGVLKTIQPKLLKEFIRPAKMIHFTTNTLCPFVAHKGFGGGKLYQSG